MNKTFNFISLLLLILGISCSKQEDIGQSVRTSPDTQSELEATKKTTSK